MADAAEELARGLLITGSILYTETANETRLAVAAGSPSQRVAFSAVGDTCPLCVALDGKVFRANSEAARRFTPPLHINCDCIWVEVGDDEEGAEDWFTPADEEGLTGLVEEHGHFVTNPEKYVPLKVPARPDGRDFTVRRKKDPVTGVIRTEIEWTRPRYELGELREGTVQTGVAARGERWRDTGNDGGGLPPAGAPPPTNRPAGGLPPSPQYRSAAGAMARQRLDEIRTEVLAEAGQLDGQFEKLSAEVDDMWRKYGRERDPVARARWLREAHRGGARLHRLVGRINATNRQVLARWRTEVLFLPEDEAATISFDIQPPDNPSEAVWRRGAEDFRRMVRRGSALDEQTIRFVVLRPTDPHDRSFCGWDGVTSHLLPTARERTVVHELGHSLELRDLDVRSRAVALYDRRTDGEALQPLRDLTEDDSFGPNELARPDEWVDVYIGKSYAGQATELVSVGAELLYADPAKLAADPEHFDFVWDILRGVSKP